MRLLKWFKKIDVGDIDKIFPQKKNEELATVDIKWINSGSGDKKGK